MNNILSSIIQLRNKNIFFKILFNIFYYLIIIFSGLIWGFGQYPEYSYIRFFGVVPLLFIIFYRKHYFIDSIIFGFVAYIINFYWLYIPIRETGNLPVLFAIFIPTILCLYYSLQYPVISYICKKLINENIKFIYFFPIVWISIDFLFPKLFRHTIADSLIDQKIFIQIIDITGMSGLIFVIMCFNLGLFIILKKIIENKHISIYNFLFLIPFFLTITYSLVRLDELNRDMKNCDYIKAAMIQGNISGKMKLQQEYFQINIDKYNNLTKEALKDRSVDLIIWPESVFNRAYQGDDEFFKKNLHENYKVPIILGITVWLPGESPTNSSILIKNRKKVMQYDKHYLLMFGEFIPYDRNFPFLRKLTPIKNNLKSGKTSSIFTIDKVKACISICFEDIFPDLIRKKSNEGSNILINLTNDSWFGNGLGPKHHSLLARLRSIENRRSLYRSTATGLTTANDFTGKIIKYGKIGNEEVVTASLPLYEKRTIYSYIGELLSYFSIILILIIIIYIIRKKFLFFNKFIEKNHN